MAVSQFLQNLIREELDDGQKRDERRSKNTVTYSLLTDDKRSDTNVATLSFKLSKPVPQAELEQRSVLQHVAEGLDTSQLGIVDAMLSRTGLRGRVGRRRTRGKVNVRLGVENDRDLESGAINSASGRFISNTNLRSLLEIVAKNYVIADMRKPTAALKYRTGRFANSLSVVRAGIDNTDRGRKPELSIFYTYMTYPYAVFDPMRSSRPALANRPVPGARNPQNILGNALAKAARDIIHSRYRITIREVNR